MAGSANRQQRANAVKNKRYRTLASNDVTAITKWSISASEKKVETRGYAATREAAMTAFAKSWRRESAAGGKPSRQLGNGSLPRPRA